MNEWLQLTAEDWALAFGIFGTTCAITMLLLRGLNRPSRRRYGSRTSDSRGSGSGGSASRFGSGSGSGFGSGSGGSGRASGFGSTGGSSHGSGSGSGYGSRSEPVLGIFTDPLARGLPVGDGGRSAIEPELREAGFYSPNAVRDYAAIRAALVLIPLLATAVSANLLDKSNIPMIAVIGGAFAALGYSLPRIYVNYRGRLRKRQIERGLPIAVDLLALGLSGGQNILNTLERVAAELSPSFPILSSELLLVLKHAQLSSLPHALRQFADRVRIPEVNNLVLVLTQTERLGTDIFSGLVEFASHFRITQRQRADAHANRASFLMLFPTVFGLWVPAGVIFVAPMIYEFRHRSYDGVELAKKQDYRGAAKKNENARKTGATGAGEVRPKSGS